MPRRKKNQQGVKIRVWAEVYSEERIIEIPAEYLEGLSKDGREKFFDEDASHEVFGGGMIGWGWAIIEDEEG